MPNTKCHTAEEELGPEDVKLLEDDELEDATGGAKSGASGGVGSLPPPPLPMRNAPRRDQSAAKPPPPLPPSRRARPQGGANRGAVPSAAERIDVDELVRDLSSRPPPVPATQWELPPLAFGVDPGRTPDRSRNEAGAEYEPSRRISAMVLLGVGAVAYCLGVLTSEVVRRVSAIDSAPDLSGSSGPEETRSPEQERAREVTGPSANVDENANGEPSSPEASSEETHAGDSPAVEAGPASPESSAAGPHPSRTASRRARETSRPRARESHRAGASQAGASRAGASRAGASRAASGAASAGEASEETSAATATPESDPVPERDRVEAALAPVGGSSEEASALPITPARNDVEAALASLRPAVSECADEESVGRVARVRLTFGGDGRVRHAVAEGIGGPTASCVARVVRSARLPAFAQEQFVVQYPYAL